MVLVNTEALFEATHTFDIGKLLSKRVSTDKNTSPSTKRWFASPKFAISLAMIEIMIMCYLFYSFGLIEGQFFRFGPPIQLFQFTVTGNKEFAGVLIVLFLHQLVFTWMNEVVSPWLLNEVQDPNVKTITFSKTQTIVLINLYYVYFSINGVLIVNVSLSQLSFLVVMIVADFVATTILNVHYIWHKKHGDSEIPCTEMQTV